MARMHLVVLRLQPACGVRARRLGGSPDDRLRVDELARTIDAVGGDGFAIRQGVWPGYVGPFVDKVIPLLQQRGAVRSEYTGTTLREHLREF
jgi:alkanesulfonate monooxygenase SsuD/methylene tetrahydromethanopterin reductase-like flavin-dependent oxidoreductase (luciferase family)